MKNIVALAATACICGSLAAKDRIVVVPAHPDDLIPCFGTCLLSKDVFEWHVVEFTHGERGMGEQGFRDGSTRKIRMAEEGAVCKELGATLHWLDEIDGEAYACRETCERQAALPSKAQTRQMRSIRILPCSWRDRFLEQWPEYAKSSPVAGRIVSKVEMPRVSIIVLDSLNARPIEYKKGTFPGELDDAQREWLAAELSAATKPVFVCAHHGIKEDNVALASTVVNAKACKGYVNGHWHRWRNDYTYASHRGRFLKHVCLPSTGHWGDIGFATFRAFGDRAVMSLTQVDYFNGRPGDSQPEREFVLQERKGAFATFSLS